MLTAQGVLAFEDNYIWLIKQTDRPQIAIVDPGDAKPVINAIKSQSLEPIAILITHHHWDHTGGIADLLDFHPMPVYGPATESIPHITQPLSEGNIVHLPELDVRLQVLDVPGHTPGHIAYYCQNEAGQGMLFCGDTLFAGGCGRLFGGTVEQMHRSLRKIRDLPDNTQVFCAHEYTEANLIFAKIADSGNTAILDRQSIVSHQRQQGQPTVPSLLGIEKSTNPFLRFDDPDLKKAAEAFAGHALPDEAAVFGAVRHWKDTLD